MWTSPSNAKLDYVNIVISQLLKYILISKIVTRFYAELSQVLIYMYMYIGAAVTIRRRWPLQTT